MAIPDLDKSEITKLCERIPPWFRHERAVPTPANGPDAPRYLPAGPYAPLYSGRVTTKAAPPSISAATRDASSGPGLALNQNRA